MTDFAPNFIAAVPAQAMKFRRVVTGERNGVSYIAKDEPECPLQMGVEGASGLSVTEFWRTVKNPATNPGSSDTGSLPIAFGPNPGGTVAQIVEWAPDRELFGTDDPAVAGAATMHRTSTIDYIMILSGEIWLVMEEGETLLRKGDTLIQRGSRHGWSNRSNEPCVFFTVMVSAEA
ncbi:cupin domain-containing protein [Variovorax paradoxus]|uniref:Cupin domain protein n=1 Tax=Variovorax paradoxus TaxID=34073 RepID=A0A0H2LRD6_VARPD|nr:cupin domain-containing protein [Variovorax paradoxus]KLN52809.1 cupin domain protein [Variovorax paradoxus]